MAMVHSSSGPSSEHTHTRVSSSKNAAFKRCILAAVTAASDAPHRTAVLFSLLKLPKYLFHQFILAAKSKTTQSSVRTADIYRV